MAIAITAIGTANPSNKRQQQEVVEFVSAALNVKPSEKRLLKSVYKATGIDYRYSVLDDYSKLPGQFEFFPNNPDHDFPSTAARMNYYKEHAIKLAMAAIEHCLESKSSFDKAAITHVITVSCTGMYAPGIDVEIIQQLSLNSTVKRTAINFMGCYGAFNGKIGRASCRERG